MISEIFLRAMSKRMRRIVVVSSVMAVLCKDPKTLHQLTKEVNEERHIADNETAFEFGYALCNFIWKGLQPQIAQIERSDWCNKVTAMIPGYVAYDRDDMHDDLLSIQLHVHM